MERVAALWSKLTTPAVLGELAALVAALLVAYVATRFTKRWRRLNPAPPPGLDGVILEGLMVVAPYLTALALALVARALLRANGSPTTVLDEAQALLGALVVIRAGTFLLRLSLGRETRFRLWENRAALVIWFFVALHLLGWLGSVINALDSIGLTTGKTRISVWSVMSALITVSVFVIVSVWVARWLERRISSFEGLAPSARVGIAKFAYAFLIGFGVLVGLRASGVDLTALTVFSGAIGLGLGFGLQAIAANLVSGFVLLMDKSIKPGDVISFTGQPGTSTEGFGWVQELRGRYIVVRDRDGVESLVPNQHVITNTVINWSHTDPKVRLKLPVRISYRDDPEVALRALLQAAEGHPRILTEPRPVSRLIAFGEIGIELELRFWIADPQEGVNNVRSDVNLRIWKLFRENGLTIPLPQREIRILNAGDLAGAGAWRIEAEPPRRES